MMSSIPFEVKMNFSQKRFIGLIFIAGILGFSCEKKPLVRSYEEIITESPNEIAAMQNPDLFPSSLTQNDKAPFFSWSVPEGWIEKKGSGLRLVSFLTNTGKDDIECSIVTLEGQAGGNESNILRWMKQIDLPEPNEEQLNKFLNHQANLKTKEGLPFQLLDFTTLQDKLENSTPSMMAAIFEAPQKTIFVKMTGSKKAVLKNLEGFKNLCLSLKLNS